MANLLGRIFQFDTLESNKNENSIFSEVSKGDEIMPAIKTLKLLAHGDHYSSTNGPAYASSSQVRRNSSDKFLPESKSAHASLSQLNSKANSEQVQTATDEGES